MSIADSKVKYAQYQLSQANRERLPKAGFMEIMGQSAVEPNKYAHNAAQISVNMSMPIFEGGQIEGEIRQQQSQRAQARRCAMICRHR